MTKSEILERDQFEMTIRTEMDSAKHTFTERVHVARLLMRHAKTYHRLQEMACNGVESHHGESNASFAKRQQRHEEWVEKRDGQIERRIRAIVASMGEGFGVVVSGDPRGCCVRLVLPSGKTNDWGREGWCVPVSER